DKLTGSRLAQLRVRGLPGRCSHVRCDGGPTSDIEGGTHAEAERDTKVLRLRPGRAAREHRRNQARAHTPPLHGTSPSRECRTTLALSSLPVHTGCRRCAHRRFQATRTPFRQSGTLEPFYGTLETARMRYHSDRVT